jgi:hypothetical protein
LKDYDLFGNEIHEPSPEAVAGPFTATDSQDAETTTWLTPKWIIDELGPFDLDPCAAPLPRPFPTAETMNSLPTDGLSIDWGGRVWLNPPYGADAVHWVRKLETHGNGIALIFARFDAAWFQGLIERNGVFLMAGRVRFLKADGTESKNTAGAPSCLIPFGRYNVGRILCSSIKGVWKQ